MFKIPDSLQWKVNTENRKQNKNNVLEKDCIRSFFASSKAFEHTRLPTAWAVTEIFPWLEFTWVIENSCLVSLG